MMSHTTTSNNHFFACPNCKKELGFFYNPDEEDKRELYCPRINCQFSTIYSDEYLSALDHFKKYQKNIGGFEFTDNNNGSITHSSVETDREVYTEATTQTAATDKTYNLSLDKVIGFTDIKDLLRSSINSKRHAHILLCSPPSVAKTFMLTSMLDELNEQGANTLFIDCSSSSPSGIAEILQSNPSVQYIVWDECDAMRKIDQKSLLLMLQNGTYRITKSRRNIEIDLKHCKSYFTANDTSKLIAPLKSRLVIITLPNYSKDEFYNVSIEVLKIKYGFPRDVSYYLVDQVYNLTSHPVYIRTVERVASLLGNDVSYTNIDKLINIMNRYR